MNVGDPLPEPIHCPICARNDRRPAIPSKACEHIASAHTEPGRFTWIEGNGSRWGGDPPLPLEDLLSRLETATLDPRLVHSESGSFFTKGPRYGVFVRLETGEKKLVGGELLFPEHPELLEFFGNFFDYSHGFHIFTDDPLVIAQLLVAIARNMEKPSYQDAVRECARQDDFWSSRARERATKEERLRRILG